MKKIRVGVIGAGRWGPNLIRNFHANAASELVAVVDTNRARLRLVQSRYPEVAVTDDPEIVFGDPLIDAIVVATPTSLHFEHALRGLKNRKHVFVEKPMARTPAECAKLLRAARKEKRVLFVGHVFVYNSGVQEVKKYIRRGELGRILYAQVTRTNLGPVRDDVNALWDLGAHDLSILNYWLEGAPTKVSAVGGKFLSKRIEDTVFATYTYPGGILANLHVSWLNPKKVREIVVVGEKKMLAWDDLDLVNPIRVYDKKVVVDRSAETLVDTFLGFHASIHEGDTLIPKVALNEPLVAECEAFLAAVRRPSSSLSPGESGKLVVDALAATDQSLSDGGREVRISY